MVLITELGELIIKGNELRINDFSNDTGEISLEGSVDSLIYSEEDQPKGSFFSRLFK